NAQIWTFLPYKNGKVDFGEDDHSSGGGGGGGGGGGWGDDTPKDVTFSFADDDRMYFMSETTAQFGYIRITTNGNINDVKTSGCELADTNGNILATHEEASWIQGSTIVHYFRINGDPNQSDICYALSPGTNYKFRSYVIYGGRKYYSSWRDFRTKGNAPTPVPKQVSFTFEDDNRMYFMSETTAQFGYIRVTTNGNINDVKTSGCELADANGSILATHEEASWIKDNSSIVHYFRINGDPNESDICYTLSPGTSYKFRSYIIYNGRKYYSSWRDFKTAGTIPAPETQAPTAEPEKNDPPTQAPTEEPTLIPIVVPVETPTAVPTDMPIDLPPEIPTEEPTAVPTDVPTEIPTAVPTEIPTAVPTEIPAQEDWTRSEPTPPPVTESPTDIPVTQAPTAIPTEIPTEVPTVIITTPAPTAVPPAVQTTVPVVVTPASNSQPFNSYTAYTRIEKVNVRKFASSSATKVDRLDTPGTAVTVIGSAYDKSGTLWLKVRLATRSLGYIRADLLTTDPGSAQKTAIPYITAAPYSPQTTPPSSSAAVTGYATTNTKKVNVRSRAESGSKSVTRLDTTGTTVMVLGQTTDRTGKSWTWVRTMDGKEGYIQSRYLDFGGDESGGTSMSDAIRGSFSTYTVTFVRSKDFSAYSGPGTQYLRGANGRAYMSSNDSAYVYGTENGWVLVQYYVSDNHWRFGYVSENLIASGYVPPLSFTRVSATMNRTANITDDPLHSVSTLATVAQGANVTVLGYLDSWVYIEYGNIRGFVPFSHVSLYP
ncbi:MAG: SH3 domain-containing protein, partial [Clostridiales bacterium]|nr:SH3 domain-containing protein [Clostridiales bacterium]